MEDRKKHAYFQDQYRRSSNFGKMDGDKEVSTDQDGDIKLGVEKTADKKEKEIRNTVDDVLKDSEEE